MMYGRELDNIVTTQATDASARQLKKAESLRRSTADSLMNAIIKVKGKR
jgi:hypothetical protein